MAGRLSQLKTRVQAAKQSASQKLQTDDGDDSVDQLQARLKRAREQAQREERAKLREQKIEEAREEAREQARKEGLDGRGNSLVDRFTRAIENADASFGGDDRGAEEVLGDPWGDQREGPGFAAGYGDGHADLDDPWADAGGSVEDPFGNEEEALEAMGFDLDDEDGWL